MALRLSEPEQRHLGVVGSSLEARRDLREYRARRLSSEQSFLEHMTETAGLLVSGEPLGRPFDSEGEGYGRLDVSSDPRLASASGSFRVGDLGFGGLKSLVWMCRPEHLLRMSYSRRTGRVPYGTVCAVQFAETPKEIIVLGVQSGIRRGGDSEDESAPRLPKRTLEATYGRDWAATALLAAIEYARQHGKSVTALHPEDYAGFHRATGVPPMSKDIVKYYTIALKQAIARANGLNTAGARKLSLVAMTRVSAAMKLPPAYSASVITRKVVLWQPPAAPAIRPRKE